MRADGVDLQMPSESAGEIKHIDVVEVDAVIAEHRLQPGDVRPLGLRELVHVAFEKIDVCSPHPP